MPPASTGDGPLPKLLMARPASAGDRVREALEHAILDGTLPQGAALVEREIAALLGVSKTPVREALKQLQSSGLVVSTAYQGVRVRRLDAGTARQLYDARLAVEPQAVRLAVERHGRCRQDSARRALAEAQALLGGDDVAQLGLANRRFHRELYVLCGNEWLISFLDRLQVLNAFLATAGWRAEATFTTEADEHATILDAVEDGAAERAEALLRNHIRDFSTALMGYLERGDSAAKSAEQMDAGHIAMAYTDSQQAADGDLGRAGGIER